MQKIIGFIKNLWNHHFRHVISYKKPVKFNRGQKPAGAAHPGNR
jgi:hypothetical protein